MAITDSGTTDSARIADDEIITKPEEETDYGWHAEFELRGYMGREFRKRLRFLDGAEHPTSAVLRSDEPP